MSKESQKRKKKELRDIPDLDIVSAFIHKKIPSAKSVHLYISKHSNGAIILNWRRSSKHNWKKLATIGFIESLGTKRYIMIINPAFGDSHILKSLFGGFDNNNIVYEKGLLPINISQAIEINNNYYIQNYANEPISIEP